MTGLADAEFDEFVVAVVARYGDRRFAVSGHFEHEELARPEVEELALHRVDDAQQEQLFLRRDGTILVIRHL